MTYIVTARKWRPMVFEDVVGQSHVATTLRNAIATNRLSHAYIFSGPRGVGKTTTARILAKAINCRSPKDSNPDNECEICQEITEGRSIDVLEIDGASNRGVDEIRNLRESVRYPPVKGKYKVYIIDEVHMLTKEAFNALLKTLEEPPQHILFIFATTEVHKVPPTILSRCQRFDFRRISIDEIIERLRFIAAQEQIKIDNDALLIIAKKADGSLRDAQSIFDQVVSFCGETIDTQQIMHALNIVDEELYFRVTNLICGKDTQGGLALVEEIISRGYDIKEFLSGLNEHLRNILIVLATNSPKLVETSEVFKRRYEEAARNFSDHDIFRLMKIVSEISSSLRWSDQPRFRLEVGLLQMIKMDSTVRIEQLLQELEDLKKKVSIPYRVVGPQPSQHDFTTDNVGVKVAGSVKASPPDPDKSGRAVLPTTAATSFATSDWMNRPKAIRHDPTPPHPKEVGHENFHPTEPYPSTQFSNLSSTTISTTKVNEPTTNFSRDGSIEKWRVFVEAAAQQKVMVGTMLRESRLVGFNNGTLQVGCPDDVHLSMLKRNREYLTEIAHQIYGAKIRLEAVLSPEKDRQQSHEHPIISALKRELGAEPIE